EPLLLDDSRQNFHDGSGLLAEFGAVADMARREAAAAFSFHVAADAPRLWWRAGYESFFYALRYLSAGCKCRRCAELRLRAIPEGRTTCRAQGLFEFQFELPPEFVERGVFAAQVGELVFRFDGTDGAPVFLYFDVEYDRSF